MARDAQAGAGVHRVFKVLGDDGGELPSDELDLSLLSLRPSAAQLLALMRGERDSYLRLASSVAGLPYQQLATPRASDGVREVRGPASTWLPAALELMFPAAGAAQRAVITLSGPNVMCAQLTYADGDRCPMPERVFGADSPIAVTTTTTRVATSETAVTSGTTVPLSSSASASEPSVVSAACNVLRACITFVDWQPKYDAVRRKWNQRPGASVHIKHYCECCQQWAADRGTLLPDAAAILTRYVERPTGNAAAAATAWTHCVPPSAALLVERFAPYEPRSILALPLENFVYLNGFSPNIATAATAPVVPLAERRCTAAYLRGRFKAHAVEMCSLALRPLSVREAARVSVCEATGDARYFSEAFPLGDSLLLRREQRDEHVVGILDAPCGARVRACVCVFVCL